MRQDHQEIYDEMMEEKGKKAKPKKNESDKRGPTKEDALLPSFPPRKPKEPKKVAMGYKKGGYVKGADGCAQRGKTKGRMI